MNSGHFITQEIDHRKKEDYENNTISRVKVIIKSRISQKIDRVNEWFAICMRHGIIYTTNANPWKLSSIHHPLTGIGCLRIMSENFLSEGVNKKKEQRELKII